MSTQLFNFLSHQVTTGPYTDQKFGLIDPEEGIAQVDFATPQNWLATVTNNKQLDIYLTPIDGGVIASGDLPGQARCDAMLTTEQSLTLVELKDRSPKKSEWRAEGIKQLASTISLLRQFHSDAELERFKNKSAYLSNKQKPNFPFSLKDDMAQFYKTHGFKLLIQAEITINK